MVNIPVILSGGSGTRLWPLSRLCHPKQLLKFDGNYSLLQITLKRIVANKNLAKPIIVCNEEHQFTILEQLKEINCDIEALIIEPEGRNTAPSILLAALYSMNIAPNPSLFVFPSDHYIENEKKFNSIVSQLSHYNINNQIMTLGITPHQVETGYGYIKVGQLIEKNIYHVLEFTEKPSKSMAEHYIKSGNYLWNSGIFIANATTLLNEFERHCPEVLEHCKKSILKSTSKKIIELDKNNFLLCPSLSFDYAIMEKTNKALVMPVQLGWNDLGNWQRIWESSEKDQNNNIIKGDVITRNTVNSYIWTKEHFLVVTLGISNLVIVQTADVCLIANKDDLDSLNPILEKMKLENRSELFINKKMYRPWGEYEQLIQGHRYQVKRVVVKPGEKLSLQLHCHRSEHWVVVRGTGKVIRGEEELILSENESTYIPYNTKHRIENIGKIDLELVEVQVGSYLGEDDIIRFDDDYGRNK